MEIEVELGEGQPLWLWGSLLALALALLFLFVGRAFTATLPEPRVFTWQDWYVFKVRRQVLAERRNLRRDYVRLYQAVESGDAIRVTVTAEELLARWEEGTAATVAQRQALQDAAQTALAWAQGRATQDEVWTALEKAREVLDEPDAAAGSRTP